MNSYEIFKSLFLFRRHWKLRTTHSEPKLRNKFRNCKEYFPNLLIITLLPQIFVFWVRDFKFWLLAYLFILFDCGKFLRYWTTFILDILQGSPFEFLVDYKNKKHQRRALISSIKRLNIKFVHYCWNFAIEK